MADENETQPDPKAGAGPESPQQTPQQTGAAQPMLLVNAQYVKDLSFENPNAPQALMEQQGAPNVQIAIDVNARQIAEKSYEVTLQLRAEGKSATTNLFIVEVAYAGIFTLGEVQEDYIAPLLYIEAPRQLFPFARNIVAECVRDGGFPPLLVQPIDFVQLYQQRAAQAKAAEAGTPPPGSNGAGPASDDPKTDGGEDDKKFQFEL